MTDTEQLADLLLELDRAEDAGELSRLMGVFDGELRSRGMALLETEEMQTRLNSRQRRKLKRMLSNVTAMTPLPSESSKTEDEPQIVDPPRSLSVGEIIQGLRSAASIQEVLEYLNALVLPGKEETSESGNEVRSSSPELTQVLDGLLHRDFLNKHLRRRIARLLYSLSPSSEKPNKPKKVTDKRLLPDGGLDRENKRKRLKRDVGGHPEENKTTSPEFSISQLLKAENGTEVSKAMDLLSSYDLSVEAYPELVDRLRSKIAELLSPSAPFSLPSDVRRKLRRLAARLSSRSEEDKEQDPGSPSPPKLSYCTLFVGQIPYDASENDIKEFFVDVGKLSTDVKVRLLTNKDNGEAGRGSPYQTSGPGIVTIYIPATAY